MWSINLRENGRIEFICSCGVGHYPYWYRNSIHGCCGCCKKDSFPGRKPKRGDLAICGSGTLGIISSSRRKTIIYPDGNKAKAWYGVTTQTGKPWSSRNPIILGNFLEILKTRIPNGIKYVKLV